MGFKPREVSDYIGRGITLPLKLVNGKPPVETGFELIRSSIRTILGWEEGSRFFLAEFGSRCGELIEEPNDDVLVALAQSFIQESLEAWEPRVELIKSDIRRVSDFKLDATITYRVISTQQVDTFIYPFYSQINY